jgi:hypothetical protein
VLLYTPSRQTFSCASRILPNVLLRQQAELGVGLHFRAVFLLFTEEQFINYAEKIIFRWWRSCCSRKMRIDSIVHRQSFGSSVRWNCCRILGINISISIPILILFCLSLCIGVYKDTTNLILFCYHYSYSYSYRQ